MFAHATLLAKLPPYQALAVWGGALIVLVAILGFGVLWIRRRLLKGREVTRAGAPGFTMEELESLRRSGGISEEEFRHLRRMMLRLDETERSDDNEVFSALPEGDDEEEGRRPGTREAEPQEPE